MSQSCINCRTRRTRSAKMSSAASRSSAFCNRAIAAVPALGRIPSSSSHITTGVLNCCTDALGPSAAIRVLPISLSSQRIMSIISAARFSMSMSADFFTRNPSMVTSTSPPNREEDSTAWVSARASSVLPSSCRISFPCPLAESINCISLARETTILFP